MRKTIENLNPGPEDLLELEPCLCQNLSRIIGFSGHAIYFPQPLENRDLTFIAEERLLLVPLLWGHKWLGMLRLEDVSVSQARRLRSSLPAMVSSLLENCLLRQLLDRDAGTGLASEEYFFDFMESEAEKMASQLSDPQISVQDTALYRFCFGLIVIDWITGNRNDNKLNSALYDNIFTELGKRLGQLLPVDSIAAPLGKYEGRREFGILFHAPGMKHCENLSEKFLTGLDEFEFRDPLTEISHHPELFAGHALYPNDMRGDELRLPMREQVRILRDRARLGMRGAYHASVSSHSRSLGFSSLLTKGGIISANLGKGRFRVNLGEAANARIGMRFQLLGLQDSKWLVKGQMVILETGRLDSVATVISMEKAGTMPQPGDRLSALSALSAWETAGKISGEFKCDDKNSPLCGHADFLEKFKHEAAQSSAFIYGIAKIPEQEKLAAPVEIIKKLLKSLNEKTGDPDFPDLLAPFGNDGIVFFYKGERQDRHREFVERLEKFIPENAPHPQVGLFAWPFLNFGRAESEECALKALEYASLLERPHIGYFNSMAITISADRKFSQGDNYGALEEYRLALLADSENAMARNSMAVCMAALGKFADAIKAFEQALDSANDTGLIAKIHYNLGVIHQKTGDQPKASQEYRKCLKKDNDHVFAWLRLGQLAEEKGERKRARKFYGRAAEKSGLEGSVYNTVQRHLARLDASGNSKDQARARLHDILIQNPQDAASLCLLAELYLDKNLDPVLAEMLARKSLQIRESQNGWQILAMAISAQGDYERAEQAKARATICKE